MVSQVHQGKPMQCTQITNESSDHYTCNNNMMQFLGSCEPDACRAILHRAVLRRANKGHLHTHRAGQEIRSFPFLATQGYLELISVLHNVINMHVPTLLHTHHYETGPVVLLRNQNKKRQICMCPRS